jgi:hypothetical protein
MVDNETAWDIWQETREIIKDLTEEVRSLRVATEKLQQTLEGMDKHGILAYSRP